MSDIVTGVRQLIQDLVAPDLKAILARQNALEKQVDQVEKHLDQKIGLQGDLLIKTIEALRAEMRSEFAILRSDFRLEVQSQLAPLKERVAVLESHAQ
jgi:hypothetical protein